VISASVVGWGTGGRVSCWAPTGNPLGCWGGGGGGGGGGGVALIFYREWYRVKETYDTQTDRQIKGRKDKIGGQIKRQSKKRDMKT
jgi:hypothetical protein